MIIGTWLLSVNLEKYFKLKVMNNVKLKISTVIRNKTIYFLFKKYQFLISSNIRNEVVKNIWDELDDITVDTVINFV